MKNKTPYLAYDVCGLRGSMIESHILNEPNTFTGSITISCSLHGNATHRKRYPCMIELCGWFIAVVSQFGSAYLLCASALLETSGCFGMVA